MYERISGYDYRLEVDSHVTKCSFGSYREILEHNLLIQKKDSFDDDSFVEAQ